MDHTVDSLLEHLKRTTGRLWKCSMIISFLTVLNVSLLYTHKYLGKLVTPTGIISLIIILVFLIFFDMMRRSGDTYYEVLCTEINWRVMTEEQIRAARDHAVKAGETYDVKIPEIAVRTTIRGYLAAKNLPIFPGMIGLPIIGMVNVFVVLLVLSN